MVIRLSKSPTGEKGSRYRLEREIINSINGRVTKGPKNASPCLPMSEQPVKRPEIPSSREAQRAPALSRGLDLYEAEDQVPHLISTTLPIPADAC